MIEEKWRCVCFKNAESEKISTVQRLIDICENNSFDRHGVNFPDENDKSYVTEFWFLNPTQKFENELGLNGIKLSKCFPKDNLGKTVVNP